MRRPSLVLSKRSESSRLRSFEILMVRVFCLAPGLCKKLWHSQLFYWVVRTQEDANQLAEEDDMIIFEGFAAK